MKFTIFHKNSGIDKKDFQIYDKFLKFLQSNLPLKKDVEIYFMGKKTKEMTTGKRTDKHKLYVLTGERLLRDVLRTLAHEWAHEFDMTSKLNDSHRKIHNKHESFANSKSGELIRYFEKKNPKDNKKEYKSASKK